MGDCREKGWRFMLSKLREQRKRKYRPETTLVWLSEGKGASES